jgi:hypothetical protein
MAEQKSRLSSGALPASRRRRDMLPPPPVSAAASDLRTGTCLAVASSALIGASFCVKKRALRVAGATGLRAGAYARDAAPPAANLAFWQAPEALGTCASRCGGPEWLRVRPAALRRASRSQLP